MDFFSVPTVTFGVLFFIIAHDRRRILRYNVTRHPTSAWVVHQLREAFPYEPATQFLILDHDSKYGTEVSAAIRSMNIKAVRTAIGCPWQNGVAERWVDSCGRELLDHVIAISESHLKRLLSSYVAYYHQDRTHCGLEKQTGRANVLRRPRYCDSAASCGWSSSSLRARSLNPAAIAIPEILACRGSSPH